MEFKKWDILEATKRNEGEWCHPIIFLEGDTNSWNDFIWAMITHTKKFKDQINIEMKREYFNEAGKWFWTWNEDSPTYLVEQRFIKFSNWWPFKKVNWLSIEWVKFIEEKLDWKEAITFEDYLNSIK